MDASNRILASIFRIGLERATKDWVSHYQQGFVPGRQLLRNVVDVDHAAQKVSIKHQRGAIVLLDLRAAFPSVAHDYMWDVLKAIGVPQAMLQALQLFYQHNQHFIKAAGQVFPSFTSTSGVRQGCPLSGIIFELILYILLRKVARVLCSDSIVRGYCRIMRKHFQHFVIFSRN